MIATQQSSIDERWVPTASTAFICYPDKQDMQTNTNTLKNQKNRFFVFDILIFVKPLSQVCAPGEKKVSHKLSHIINYQQITRTTKFTVW